MTETVKKKLIFALIFLTFLSISFFWFNNLNNLTLNQDEVTYTLNTQFYFARIQRQMNVFLLPEDYQKLQWSNLQYQLIDQPQLGKYLMGFILKTKAAKITTLTNSNKLYQEFASGKLPGGKKLQNTKDHLGPELVNSISILRIASALFGLSSLALFAFSVAKFTNNTYMGLSTFVITTLHPLLRYQLRIATTNSFSLFFLILTTLIMYKALQSYKKLKPSKLIIYSFILGILIACATSIKLNATFLLVFPFLYFMLLIIMNFFKHKRKVRITNLKKAIIFYATCITSFLITFYYLEPELWINPNKGIQSLYGIRLLQQSRFYSVYGKIPYFLTFLSTLKVLLQRSKNLILVSAAILFILLGAFELFRKAKQDLNHNLLAPSMLIFILAANSYYARINFEGFDRYFIPTILVYILLASIGLHKTLKFLIFKLQLMRKF